MNVLFYNGNRSVGFGGIEHWMLDVASGLTTRGHRAVLYGRFGAAWLEHGRRQGLTCMRGFVGVDFHPVALAWLYAALRAHRIDVIFAKGKKGARSAAVAARLAGRGAVALVLGIEGELSRRVVDRLTWRYAVDRAVVLAEEARAWYERLGWTADGKLCVVQKGVDVAAFDPARIDGRAVRTRLGLDPGTIVVGSVGRLVWQKGHVFLVRAAAALRDVLPEARYLMVGAGSEEGALRHAARTLGVEDRVVFAGYSNGVAELLAAMDVFAVPSRKENMPQVLLEAMAMARPVVTTATIGVREVIDDGSNGFVVPVGDTAALADRILRLSRDSGLRVAVGARARARIADGYTRAHMLDRVERFLGEMQGRGSPDRRTRRSVHADQQGSSGNSRMPAVSR
jgi:glycosyltransferase involved in cell wall biosynthesis